MKYNIRGTVLPILDVELQAGESVYTEAGGMAWMSPNVKMDAEMRGGLGKSIGRVFGGESLFMTNYTATEGTAAISFCMEFPGQIIPMEIKPGQSVICQKDAFMMAEQSVELKLNFRKKLGAGFFGGEGFIMQEVSGEGMAFLELAGEITEYELQPGQVLKVDPGYLGAYEPTVEFDITRVKGIKNMFFGGEGLFLTTLKGPGKVWLQSMPLPNLAKRLLPYIPTGS